MQHEFHKDRQAHYRYCPHDAAPLELRIDQEGQPRPTCPRCNFIDWKNPKPCVAVLLIKAGRVLLARRAIEPAKGMWDIPGGFVSAGETAEQAAIREMSEETGLSVRITGYVGSAQDTYGDRAEPTLNLCFLAEQVGGKMRAQSDVAALRWFSPLALPDKLAFPHQYALLHCWFRNS